MWKDPEARSSKISRVEEAKLKSFKETCFYPALKMGLMPGYKWEVDKRPPKFSGSLCAQSLIYKVKQHTHTF